jgi:hypothetical protein
MRKADTSATNVAFGNILLYALCGTGGWLKIWFCGALKNGAHDDSVRFLLYAHTRAPTIPCFLTHSTSITHFDTEVHNVRRAAEREHASTGAGRLTAGGENARALSLWMHRLWWC